ncbi:hypothetical protein RmaAA213_29050 [Rhodothermus marinus]|nr:hypothetical protein RmaAA213_29050 [Rhodothermus marinus]BBM74038.1 hypothetical protein RmaAA338_29030 [Rhodothermus marinus]
MGSAFLTLTQAFRWHPDNPDQDQNGQPDVLPLETPGYNSGEAWAVSADGGVIVGVVYNWSLLEGPSPREAFRWTETDGLQLLGTLGGEASLAENVSADGAIVVGSAQNQFGKYHAFRWTAADGMQPLGTLMYVLYDSSTATAVSDDGSVVVGWAHVPGNDVLVAFRVDNGVLSELAGPTAYPQTQAYDVTADGSMVVGVMFNENGERRAFRWTDGVGLEDLSAVYADLLTPVGSYLRTAQAISPNGRYIVGQGFNAATNRLEAFLLDTWQTTAAEPTDARPEAPDTAALRVVSYNLRFDNPADGPNAWPHRIDRIAAFVRFFEPDVLGVQEALRAMLDSLQARLPDYRWVGVGRTDGRDGGEFSAIFYRTDRFCWKATRSGFRPRRRCPAAAAGTPPMNASAPGPASATAAPAEHSSSSTRTSTTKAHRPASKAPDSCIA